jgi:hypothetical protein
MKKFLGAVLVLFSLSALAADRPASKPGTPSTALAHTTGRFQLFYGSYGVTGSEVSCVMRIDTETGRTWVLYPPTPEPKVRQFWVEVLEFPAQEPKPSE